MLDAGRVFAAVPPLHRIELTSPRKGQQRYIYTYSDGELRRTLLELERKGQRWKEPLQRYKGLGEMDASQLAETTMDPRHRTLRRIRLEDTAAADRHLRPAHGQRGRAAPRLHRRAARPSSTPPASIPDGCGRPSGLPPGPVPLVTAGLRHDRVRLVPVCPDKKIRDEWLVARLRGQAAQRGQRLAHPDPGAVPAAVGRGQVHRHAGLGGAAGRRRAAQASTRASSPLRNRWQRTPPVARPLAGYSRYGVTFTVAAAGAGQRADRAGDGDHHRRPPVATGDLAVPGGGAASARVTAPNQITEARADSRMPAMPAAARPCGRTTPRRTAAAGRRW